ncbi:hypothetical protein NDU88_001192 [Pleurodeles waltl]|uniref:Uncharacterized protein n=1 Tax=Pleurodeles waltl TaxID=8319 RepID=A0AAV7U6D3_PLEWA|nr:hypothetical protein NDU88_001192 [Pleurodeles waltl]
MDTPDAPSKEQDTTFQALRQMELTLRNHTSQFERVLQAIVDTKTTLESKISEVTMDVNLLRTDHCAQADRVADVEKDLVELSPTGPEVTEEGWSSPKEKCKRGSRSGIKPTPEQVVEERSCLIWEATRFVADPPAVMSDQLDTEPEHESRSESAYSLSGSILTPRSADDI